MIHLTASQIDRAVRDLYKGAGYTVLSEVRNGTGYTKRTRTADMLAVSTWPSRGLFVEGFEIKSSKGDLRRELENPAKADDIAAYCRFWWLAGAEGLTDGLIIPPNWGVISINEKLKARVETKAKELTPRSMDDLLVCSILRNFAESYVHLSEVQPQIEAARKDERESAESRRGSRLKELEAAVETFKTSSGIDLMGEYGHVRWDIDRVGEAVRLILNMRERPVQEMLNARAALQSGITAIEAALGPLTKEFNKDGSPRPTA